MSAALSARRGEVSVTLQAMVAAEPSLAGLDDDAKISVDMPPSTETAAAAATPPQVGLPVRSPSVHA